MNLLILRSGLLGDTLVTLPALWALRQAYPDAHIRYVLEALTRQEVVQAQEVLAGSGLVDAFDTFYSGLSFIPRTYSRLALLQRLRRTPWDIGISLAEPFWSPKKKQFARWCGAQAVLGPEGQGERHPRSPEGKLLRVSHIADTLVRVLEPLGIELPQPQQGRIDLALNAEDESQAAAWLKKAGVDRDSRPRIALGLGSNMPAKRWQLDRYLWVVQSLSADYNIVPIVFGSASERAEGEHFVGAIGRGYVSCGELGVRAAASVMQRCRFYLGNDTGAMHLAAGAGIPCVAIFSSRDSPGRWEPYGLGHRIFRAWVSCEGCMLRICETEKMRCILAIQPEEVIAACRELLQGYDT